MAEKLTLYPIYAVGEGWDDEPFNPEVLPFSVTPFITVEDVSSLFNDETSRWVEREMGRHDMEDLRSVRYAVVHRYSAGPYINDDANAESGRLVREVAACLRLIRPMRQRASLIQGEVKPVQGFDVQHFEHPINLMEVPEVQKLFHLRNRDLPVLREVAARFLAAMHGEYWKVRMAVQFHDHGHLEGTFWKPRYSLWMAGLEALYTAPDSDHSGRLVTTEQAKHFLGADTNIYEPGDVPSCLPQAEIRVGDVLKDLYAVRNCIVHGERVPDEFFGPCRQGPNGPVNRVSVLLEALSFILRKSILRVLKENLLEEFKDSPASRRYWGGFSLTRRTLLGREFVLKILRGADHPLTTDEITQIINKEVAAKVRRKGADSVAQCIEAGIRSGAIVASADGRFAAVPC
jgi:hypothetical protein